MALSFTTGGKMTGKTSTATSVVSFPDQTTTFDAILVDSSSYFRRFWQGEGTAVQGTWLWLAEPNHTNFASITGQSAGYYRNSSVNNSDEYKWSSVFLSRGTYKITIMFVKYSTFGIGEVLFGTASLDTQDYYAAGAEYNNTWTINFTLTADTTADLRFCVNGKTGTNYYINFSRFQIEKTG